MKKTNTNTNKTVAAFILTNSEIDKLKVAIANFDKADKAGVALCAAIIKRAASKGIKVAKRSCPIRAAVLEVLGDAASSTVYRWFDRAVNGDKKPEKKPLTPAQIASMIINGCNSCTTAKVWNEVKALVKDGGYDLDADPTVWG